MGIKNYYTALALIMAACATTEGRSAFMDEQPLKAKQKPIEPMTPEREQKIMQDIERNMHDFNINGTIIRAKNRKTAIKIYNNRNNK